MVYLRLHDQAKNPILGLLRYEPNMSDHWGERSHETLLLRRRKQVSSPRACISRKVSKCRAHAREFKASKIGEVHAYLCHWVYGSGKACGQQGCKTHRIASRSLLLQEPRRLKVGRRVILSDEAKERLQSSKHRAYRAAMWNEMLYY